MAGRAPASNAVTKVAPRAKASTPGLISKTIQGGGVSGVITRAKRSSENFVSTRPTRAPPKESRRVSLRSCRSTRVRAAPSALRMASSLPRAMVVASRRLATLAQAMSSTPNTATNIV